MIQIISGDPYRIRTRKQVLINEFLANNDSFALEDIDIEDSHLEVGDVINLLAATSLFNPRRMVVLKNMSRRPDFKEQIEAIAANAPQDVSLVIIESKLDKKTRFGKFLSSHPEHKAYPPYKGAELEAWLIKLAADKQSRITSRTATYLIQKTGPETLALESEMRKLCMYPEITDKLIDELVSPVASSQIFDLLDALMQGHLGSALSLYDDQRQQKNEPLSILGILVWQLRILLIAKKSKSSSQSVATEFGINQFALNKASNLVRRMSMAHLGDLLALCHQTDERIRCKFVNPDMALRFLIFKSCYLKRLSLN